MCSFQMFSYLQYFPLEWVIPFPIPRLAKKNHSLTSCSGKMDQIRRFSKSTQITPIRKDYNDGDLTEPDSNLRIPCTPSSRSSSLWYLLGNTEKYLQSNKQYWGHLTIDSYEIYSKLYELCKDPGHMRVTCKLDSSF